MSLSAVLLAILLILWGLAQFVIAVPAVVLGVLALITGIVMFVERIHPIRTI